MFLSNTDSTMMSVLFGIANEEEDRRSHYLNRFCETYSKPLLQYLIATKRLPEDEATDIVHEFWLRKVLEPTAKNNLIAKFLDFQSKNPNASFRKYLARSLSHFFINRYHSAKEKRKRQAVPLDGIESLEFDADSAIAEFDVIWSTHILQGVLDGVRKECAAKGHQEKWEIFVAMVLKPCLTGKKADSYKVLADRFGLSSSKDVGNAWITVKRMIRRHIDHAVQDYLPVRSLDHSTAASQAEAEELLLQLARAGRLMLAIPELGVANGGVVEIKGFDLESNPIPALFRSENDMSEIWQSLSNAPLDSWLNVGGLTDFSVFDLIRKDDIALELFQELRIRSKQLGRIAAEKISPEDFVPREICGLIYLLSIALAKLRFNIAISDTPTTRLCAKMHQYLGMSWVDENSRMVLKTYINSGVAHD